MRKLYILYDFFRLFGDTSASNHAESIRNFVESRCAKTCFKAWCFSLAAVGGEKNIKKIAGHVQGVFVIYINMPLSFLDVYVSISYLWNISGEHYDLTV